MAGTECKGRGRRSRLAIGGIVFALHCAIVAAAFTRSTDSVLPTRAQTEFISTAQIIVQSETWDRVPAPDVQLQSVMLSERNLKQIQFAESLEDELAGVIGPASAPRLSRFQTADVAMYARRAHVRAGHPVTVVLIVNVLEDGQAGSVDVQRSSGISDADAAAVDYALELRWIPGTRNQQPLSMRVLLPVTLTTS